MARILMYPHNFSKSASAKTIFKFNQYRIVHSPAGIIRRR